MHQTTLRERSSHSRLVGTSIEIVPNNERNISLFPDSHDLMCRALHRAVPRHVALVSESNIGTKYLFEEVARLSSQGHLPQINGLQFVNIDCRHLLPTDWKRIMGSEDDTDNTVLCLNGFGAFLRGKSPADREAIFASLHGPSVPRCVCAFTSSEYDDLLANNGFLRESFARIELPEPYASLALALTTRAAESMSGKYTLRIDNAAVEQAIALTSVYLPSEPLPDKAIRVLQSLCDAADYERACDTPRSEITADDVLAEVARVTGIPQSTLSGTGEDVDYEAELRKSVVGQDHAVREVATELGLLKAGFADPGKPASVMMFIGQTGTGKTELAKAMARLYSPTRRLRIFTLGNFSEPHSVSGIVGVPAGYVGHDQGGRLINELNQDMFGVFLLDEADKAHPDVMQPFLNLFDEGWVCDQRGVKAHAGQAIFVLTTNIGHRQVADMCAGGKSDVEITFAVKEMLSKIRHTKSNRPVFTPEFMARVKRVIVFRSLEEGAMCEIARGMLAKLQADFAARRGKTLVVPAELADAIGGHAHALDRKAQGKEGGRVVRKIIADAVEAAIQRAIARDAGQYRECSSIVITFESPENDDAMEPALPTVRVTFDRKDSQS